MRFALKISIRIAFAVITLAIGIATEAIAQYRAGIQGVVTDSQGAVVIGATVKLINKDTNRTLTTKSSEDGFYRFDRLPPGSYRISAELANFKKKFLENVEVKAEDVQGINLVLEPGNVDETVTISSQVTAQIARENASIDGSITTQEILRLPQTGRDPYELLRLTPGIFGLGARDAGGASVRLPNTPGPGGSNTSIFQVENQVPISANGQRLEANSFEIDGVSVNSQTWGGAAVVTPNQESVKEVRVVANSYSAEFGRNSGALIQVVSQNGTNQFHGSAFFKYNDPALNAFNRWGGASGGAARRVQNRFRQFGGSIGGPVYLPRFGQGGQSSWSGKDKLFFFFSFERLRNRTSNFGNQWVETPEFAQLLQSTRPGSLAAQLVNMPGMQPVVDNVIPGTCAGAHNSLNNSNCRVLADGRLDLGSPALAIALGQRVVDRLGGGFDGIPDIQFSQITRPGNNTAQQFNGRVDFQATQKDLFALSFYYTPNDNLSTDARGREALQFLSGRRNTAGALLWNRIFSPTFLNEARFNVTRWFFDEFGSNPNLPWGIPYAEISEVLPTIGWGRNGAGVFYQTAFNFRDIVSKVAGNHGLKFGGEISREQNNDTIAGPARPSYFFGNIWNFTNDAPIRETGNFDPRTGIPTDVKKYIRAGNYSLFIQDDWKARPNLTLNLGLRWEYWTPLKEKFGNLSKFVPGDGMELVRGGRFVTGESLHDADPNNFGPQFGFAWSPSFLKNKSVLRGGFGIGYNRIPYSITLSGRTLPPFVGSFTLTAPADILYAFGSDLTSPGGYPSNPRTILAFDPVTGVPTSGAMPNVNIATLEDVPNPYTYRYSLETQYELGTDWVASLGFQGSTGHKLTRVINGRLFARAGFIANYDSVRIFQIRFLQTDVNTNFNALITRLTKRFSKGFNFNLQYRWSKSIDTCSDDQNCVDVLTFPFDQSTERGPSDYDVTHNFVASGLWDLPILGRRKDVLGKAFGGWQLNGILTMSSGFPWTPVFDPGNCGPMRDNGFQCPQRPLAYLGGLEQDRSKEAFQRPGGTFGPGAAARFISPTINASPPNVPGIGRNVFRGPGYFTVDVSAIKRIGLPKFFGEIAGFDIRANLYNVFNTLNLKPFEFNTNSTRVNHIDFGRATDALSGRVVEFQARFYF